MWSEWVSESLTNKLPELVSKLVLSIPLKYSIIFTIELKFIQQNQYDTESVQ